MAPRTRRSQASAQMQHTQPVDESNDSFQASTRTTKPTKVTGRSNSQMQPDANLPGRKCTISTISDNPQEAAEEATSMPLPTTIPTKKTRRTNNRMQPDANLPGHKRTIHPQEAAEEATSMPPPMTIPTKKARHAGPVRPHPLQLNLENRDGIEDQREKGDGRPVVATSRELHRTFSFSATRGDCPFPLNPPNANGFEDPGDDSETEMVSDWDDEDHLAQLARREPSKFRETLRLERPTLQDLDVSSTSTISENMCRSGQYMINDSDTSLGSSRLRRPIATLLPGTALGPEPLVSEWPRETELIFLPGTNRLSLSVQLPLMRMVIQDAIEHLRASILFRHAFPDPRTTISFISEALLAGAAAHQPDSFEIQQRLIQDEDYVSKMSRLPRARIALFRSEVKDRCAHIVLQSFRSLTPTDITHSVQQQLSKYAYIFPNNNPLAIPMRPYRNSRIVDVIQELYFTGGSNAFANRFRNLFPESEDSSVEEVQHEVPIAMVALVATALYAALDEWRTGKRQATEFSANANLDVYLGHVSTFANIQNKRSKSYHTMMASIYNKASDGLVMQTDGASGGIMAMELDMDCLDG